MSMDQLKKHRPYILVCAFYLRDGQIYLINKKTSMDQLKKLRPYILVCAFYLRDGQIYLINKKTSMDQLKKHGPYILVRAFYLRDRQTREKKPIKGKSLEFPRSSICWGSW